MNGRLRVALNQVRSLKMLRVLLHILRMMARMMSRMMSHRDVPGGRMRYTRAHNLRRRSIEDMALLRVVARRSIDDRSIREVGVRLAVVSMPGGGSGWVVDWHIYRRRRGAWSRVR